MSSKKTYLKAINSAIKLKKKLLKFETKIYLATEMIYRTLVNNNKIFICGNGGSAADAQHLAAEFMVRLRPNINRKPYPVISLSLDISTITACANDYSFDDLFSRNLIGLSKPNDLLISMSTSGNSKNIIKVLKTAKKIKVNSISLLGNKGGNAKNLANLDIIVPSNKTARIQEAHIFLGHFVLERVEDMLLKKKSKNIH
jgi:D-sedoheptulose 7-phosphate isomerase